MKELELNVDNLILLWEADEIKGKSLKDWVLNNEDIFIDNDNKIIYTGIIKFIEDFATLIDLKNQDLLCEGLTSEEINLRLEASNVKEDALLKDLFKNIPVDKRSSLAIELLLKLKDRFYKEKSDYLDHKIDLLLGKSKQLKVPNDPVVKPAIPVENPKITEPIKKIPEKWHALLYLLEIQATNGKIPVNSEGDLIKKEIEEIGKQIISGSTGQSFYRNVQKFRADIKDLKKIDRMFPDNWRDTIISLSNNNEIIIEYLKIN